MTFSSKHTPHGFAGNQGEAWFERSIPFRPDRPNMEYKLVIAAEGCTAYDGDIAVDRISVRPGNC